ncbi:hypothetical protein BDY24DRAFT_392295 [Mrakia frigida]|uniref:GNAT family N-acetyltransferase n=1 Tax=Mrakia frigida TaxID=29902 RepID=UPI003FCC22D3
MTSPHPPRPQISLSHEVLSEDYLALADIHVRAFGDPRKAELIYPLSLRLSHEQRVAHNAFKRTRRARLPPADLVELVARLPDGSLAGIASYLRPIDRTSTKGDPLPSELAIEAEWEAIFEKEGKSEVQLEMEGTMDLGFAEKFGAELDRVRKEWSKGRRHWYLSIVVIDPTLHGLGIGSKLLDWGLEQAKKDGVPCFLEASESGRPLYESRGFKVVNWCEFDDAEGPTEDGKLRFPGMAWGGFEEET